jgi:hypothetical protein
MPRFKTPPSTTHRKHAKTPYRVVGRVHACFLEFDLVFVRSADDFQYVLTPETEGIRLSDLHEGESIDCVISAGLPRALSASLVPRPT